MITWPIIHGSPTFGMLDSSLAEDYLLHPKRYNKVCFSPVGPVFQVTGCSSRTLKLRQFFADGGFSDSSHRITGTTMVYVLTEFQIFYNQ